MTILTSTSFPTLIYDGLVILLGAAVIAGTALSIYLLILALAGLRAKQTSKHDPADYLAHPWPATRFAILVPAHDEQLVIGRLLESIDALNYPSHLFEVHVIADHCTDETAAIARSFEATVHERSGADPRGKSHSLQWLLQHLLYSCESADGLPRPVLCTPDAFIILDADSTVAPNFLSAMDLHLRSGSKLIQSLVQIDDAGASSIGQLRALAYEFISHIRPLGRSALGLSVGLRGNGMCMARDIAEGFPWDSGSLTEDYELHSRLLAAGLRVTFAPDAVVRTQLPRSLAAARTQSERWERGRLDVMARYVPGLLGEALKRRSLLMLDGAIELLIPPFSVFMAVMLVLFGLSLLSGVTSLVVVAAVGLVAQCLYTLRGLALTSSRYPHIYRALLVAPAFIAWRLGCYLKVLALPGQVQWIRTARTPAPNYEQAVSPNARRICIIRHYYYPEDPRSRREAEALAEAGHHVDILTLRLPGEPAHELINGVHVRRLPVKHYRRSLFHYAYEYGAFFTLAFAVVTAGFIRRRYDVVQVNSLPDFLVFAGAACKLLGARLVLDMHECTPELYCTKYRVSSDHPLVRALAWVEQLSLAFADQVITCTPQQREVFASRGTPPEKIAVVLNAANSAIFKPRTPEPVLWQPGERFELVAHGLVAERYGLDTMVRAVAILACEIPDVVLHVYGKGDYLPEMEALALRLGVGHKVVAHGFVPEETLLDGIANAHVGVIAAKRDNFRELTHTQKMYEYVAMRKPVVIAETSAVRTHFDDSCFQFFASDDPADLARALRELYNNPARALAMVESASMRYRSYSWEAQRHVYREAALGVPQYIPQPVGARAALHERIAQVKSSDLRPVPVEATPTPPSRDLTGMVAPVEDGGIYLGGIVAPVEEGVSK